jgi:hypothetical protein
MTKIGSKNNLYPHRYFSEQLVDAFEKSPRESNLNHESSSLFIRWLKRYTNISLQQFIHRNKHKTNQIRPKSNLTDREHWARVDEPWTRVELEPFAKDPSTRKQRRGKSKLEWKTGTVACGLRNRSLGAPAARRTRNTERSREKLNAGPCCERRNEEEPRPKAHEAFMMESSAWLTE